MLTGFADMKMAIRAIKSGAFDYVVKGTPDFEEELPARIHKAKRHIGLLDRTYKLEQRVSEQAQKVRLLGDAPAMLKLRSQVLALKGREATVVITGESGTGKEVVARNLSYQDGLQRPFVAVNCGAIPENLVESELFGHEKGAFTGATQRKVGLVTQAHGGDLFLDEVGELPLSMQVKLLRVLQERVLTPLGSTSPSPFRSAWIAATNRDLAQMVREGSFREDLYYRLSVMTIQVPALREHPEDIPALAAYFLGEFGAPSVKISPEAMNLLKKYRWPGNIRALKNCIERASIALNDTGTLTLRPEHIHLDDTRAEKGSSVAVPLRLLPKTNEDLSKQSFQAFTQWAEQLYFDHAFSAAQKNKSRLAEKLNLSRDFMHRKLKSLGIGVASETPETTEAGPRP